MFPTQIPLFYYQGMAFVPVPLPVPPQSAIDPWPFQRDGEPEGHLFSEPCVDPRTKREYINPQTGDTIHTLRLSTAPPLQDDLGRYVRDRRPEVYTSGPIDLHSEYQASINEFPHARYGTSASDMSSDRHAAFHRVPQPIDHDTYVSPASRHPEMLPDYVPTAARPHRPTVAESLVYAQEQRSRIHDEKTATTVFNKPPRPHGVFHAGATADYLLGLQLRLAAPVLRGFCGGTRIVNVRIHNHGSTTGKQRSADRKLPAPAPETRSPARALAVKRSPMKASSVKRSPTKDKRDYRIKKGKDEPAYGAFARLDASAGPAKLVTQYPTLR